MLRAVPTDKTDLEGVVWLDPDKVTAIGPQAPDNTYHVYFEGMENILVFRNYKDSEELARAIKHGEIRHKKVTWADLSLFENNERYVLHSENGECKVFMDKVVDCEHQAKRSTILYFHNMGIFGVRYDFTKSEYKNWVQLTVDISNAYFFKKLKEIE